MAKNKLSIFNLLGACKQPIIPIPTKSNMVNLKRVAWVFIQKLGWKTETQYEKKNDSTH